MPGCWSGAAVAPRVFPGWTFGYEYYIERGWLALRRGALWEFALERNLVVPLTVRWYGGTRVEVTLGNDNSLCLYVAGSFEPNEFAFLDGVLRPGMTFIDVGANEGCFSLHAARRVGRGGRVVAVEPSSRERRQLERNVARNRLRQRHGRSACAGRRGGNRAPAHRRQGAWRPQHFRRLRL